MSRDPYDPQQHQIRVLEEIEEALGLISGHLADLVEKQKQQNDILFRITQILEERV